jgi:hypothetical protein
VVESDFFAPIVCAPIDASCLSLRSILRGADTQFGGAGGDARSIPSTSLRAGSSGTEVPQDDCIFVIYFKLSHYPTF